MLLIYGKGKSGLSAYSLAEKKGFKAVLVDDKDFKEEYLRNVSLIVVSPGIPFNHQIFKLAKRRSIPIIGEVEFAFRFWRGKIISITGTDGKSTTTKLIYEILKTKYPDVYIGGNYGIPFSQIVSEHTEGIAVLELSSFQIYSTVSFKPNTAVFLNFSKDHLDWHKKISHYLFSKYKLFKNQTSTDTVVLNFDNLYTYETKTKGRKLFFSLEPLPEGYEGTFLKDKKIFLRIDDKEEELISVDEIPLKGIHMFQNIMASILVGSIYKVEKENILQSIKAFKPLPFRLEYEGSFKGIDIYNDAKSTTVQSLKMAIKSFQDKKVVLIAGGINKGGDFSLLREEKNIKKVILIGRDKEIIKKSLENFFPVEISENLQEAFKKSLKSAEKNDVILFSPGCASFDMFKNYIDRGESFKRIVREIVIDD